MKVFIGVDQTGALKAGARGTAKTRVAKPLPAVRYCSETGEISLHELSSFTPPVIYNEFGQLSDLFFLIDCVLGLPAEVSGFKGIWSEFVGAHRFSTLQGLGRQPARQFFENLLHSRVRSHRSREKSFPVRSCERLAGANSVFQTHPFQKNIQTGTFRFWVDLGENGKPWAKIWPHDFSDNTLGRKGKASRLPIIAEGYPSLLWNRIFGMKTRDPEKLVIRIREDLELRSQLKISETSLVKLGKSPDFADAFVLAYGAFKLSQNRETFKISKFKNQQIKQEGWIAGL